MLYLSVFNSIENSLLLLSLCHQVDANRDMNAVVNDCLQAMVQRNVVDEARREMLLAATHTEEMISYMPIEVQSYIMSREFAELVHGQVSICRVEKFFVSYGRL